MVQGAGGLGSAWEAPVDLSSASEIGEPQVAVDPAGDAVVSWIIDNQSPQVATKTANGSWQPPIYVPHTGVLRQDRRRFERQRDRRLAARQLLRPRKRGPGDRTRSDPPFRERDGSGSGTISSAPAGIDCGPVCSAQFEDDSTATLTAVAAAGSEFVGWSGACTGMEPCTVALSASRSVSATFKLLPPQPEPRPVTGSAPSSAPPTGCNAVAASAGTFVPIPGPGRAVAGVRAKVRVAAPSQLQIEPTLTYMSGGQTHRVDLATVALHTAAARNLRMALPTGTRAAPAHRHLGRALDADLGHPGRLTGLRPRGQHPPDQSQGHAGAGGSPAGLG
jgi:List-Bact-rpt repeat protein